jgi:uroporphyrin-III C-methyltransferase
MAENKIADRQNQPSVMAIIAMLLSFSCIGLIAWVWVVSNQHFSEIEKSLSNKLDDFRGVNEQAFALAKQADERSAQTQAQTILIQEKLAESRDQQEVLQTLYDQLAEDREETVLAEVEQLVTIANQQLQLSNNIKAALLAMQAAEKHLEPIHLPRANQLREVIGNDIQMLREYPQTDMLQVSDELDRLTMLCTNLPLISERKNNIDPVDTKQNLYEATKFGKVQRFAYAVWDDMKQLVTIERMDKPEPPLLTASHSFYLRENLKLRLITARIAFLQHDETSYNADLSTVKDWLNQYFDTKHPNAENALTVIAALQANKIAIEMPQLKESIEAIARYKVSLEKS